MLKCTVWCTERDSGSHRNLFREDICYQNKLKKKKKYFIINVLNQEDNTCENLIWKLFTNLNFRFHICLLSRAGNTLERKKWVENTMPLSLILASHLGVLLSASWTTESIRLVCRALTPPSHTSASHHHQHVTPQTRQTKKCSLWALSGIYEVASYPLLFNNVEVLLYYFTDCKN